MELNLITTPELLVNWLEKRFPEHDSIKHVRVYPRFYEGNALVHCVRIYPFDGESFEIAIRLVLVNDDPNVTRVAIYTHADSRLGRVIKGMYVEELLKTFEAVDVDKLANG